MLKGLVFFVIFLSSLLYAGDEYSTPQERIINSWHKLFDDQDKLIEKKSINYFLTMTIYNVFVVLKDVEESYKMIKKENTPIDHIFCYIFEELKSISKTHGIIKPIVENLSDVAKAGSLITAGFGRKKLPDWWFLHEDDFGLSKDERKNLKKYSENNEELFYNTYEKVLKKPLNEEKFKTLRNKIVRITNSGSVKPHDLKMYMEGALKNLKNNGLCDEATYYMLDTLENKWRS